MPHRIIREGILTSEKVNRLSVAAEVFYRRLMSVADDHGRYDGRPAILRTALFPLRVDDTPTEAIAQWLQECVEQELVQTYLVAGKAYLELTNFGQRIRSASKWPGPADNGAQVTAPCGQLTAEAREVRTTAREPELPGVEPQGLKPSASTSRTNDSGPRASDGPISEAEAEADDIYAARPGPLPEWSAVEAFCATAGIDPQAAKIWWHGIKANPISRRNLPMRRDGSEIHNWRQALKAYAETVRSNHAQRQNTHKGRPGRHVQSAPPAPARDYDRAASR